MRRTCASLLITYIAAYHIIRKDFFMLRKVIFFISARCVLSYLIGKKVAKVMVMTSVTNSYRFNSLTCSLFAFLYFPHAKNLSYEQIANLQ